MDASTLNRRNSQHVRSKSVPSNPHPIISQVDEQLSRLRDSEAISSSSSSLCHKLSALQDLHDSVDKLLILPLSQQALVPVSDKEELDNLLEGSLRLLDLCDTAKKALMQTRECTHEFESVLRRRRSEIGTSSSLKKCLSSRKMIKKAIHKVLRGMESKQSNKDSESFTFVNQIKEVEAVTSQSIVSLLFFIAGPKLPAKWICWSSVSKLVQSKKVAFALNPRNSHHIRSNSLPSKPHPIIEQVGEHLCRLKEASEATSSSSFELCHKLNGLQDLHDCVDRLLLLPLTQLVLADECDKKWFNDLLEGSVRLLDLCDIAKDALLQTKECVHELESVLRRGRGGKMFIESELQKCSSSRKLIKKTIYKALKIVEIKSCEKNLSTPATISLLKQVEAISYNIIKSLLSFLAGTKFSSNSSRWSLVAKLVQPKRVACWRETLFGQ